VTSCVANPKLPVMFISFVTTVKRIISSCSLTNKSAGILALNWVLVGVLGEYTLAEWLTCVSWSCVHVVKIMNQETGLSNELILGS